MKTHPDCIKTFLVTLFFSLMVLPMTLLAQTTGSISSNFNGTSIAGGRYLLFNAHITSVSFSGVAATAPSMVLEVKNIKATFTANSTNYVVQLPDSKMTFSNSASSATGNYIGSKWEITYPKSASNNPLISALMWPVPSTGLPGGINPVTMTADFYTNVGTITSLNWQWSAAVYTQAPSDPNALGILFLDGARQSGTPMNYRSYVTGGARGGGGSNYTGSWSATKSVTNIAVLVTPPTGFLSISRNYLFQGTVIPVGYTINR